MANNNENKILNVPNLRFPEFTGEWKAERLNDIAILTKGAGISKDQLSEVENHVYYMVSFTLNISLK